MTKTKIFAKRLLIGSLFCAFGFAAINSFLPSAIAETPAANECSVKAYIDDRDPEGTNIRAAPNKNSAVLRQIKNDEVIVSVSKFSGGWFEISSAADAGGEKIFQGRGWIYSELLGMQVASADAKLYAQPKKNSPVLIKLIPGASEVKIVACQNNWVKIQTGGKTGWLSPEGQCGNPVTTCS